MRLRLDCIELKSQLTSFPVEGVGLDQQAFYSVHPCVVAVG